MKKFRERKKDETKNRKTLRKAAYQYVLDHAYPTPKGLVVNFFLPPEDDFYRKLEAREYLDYVRVQKEEQYTGYNAWLVKYKKMERGVQFTEMMNKRTRIMYQNGTLYEKFLIKIKRWATRQLRPRLLEIPVENSIAFPYKSRTIYKLQDK